MRSSFYVLVLAFVGALFQSACDSNNGVGFNGPPVGGTGGTGGTGGGTATEPQVIVQTVFQTGLFNIKLSGDAAQLVFVSDHDFVGQNPNNGEQIFGANISTGAITQITSAAVSNQLLFGDWDITDNGTQVLFASRDDLAGSNATLSHNLFLANTDGSGITQVTQNSTGGGFAEWELSGDGSLVVFTSDMDLLGTNATNDRQLYSVNADGTGLAQITTGAVFVADVALAQNGSRVTYISAGDHVGLNPDSSRELYVINVDGNDHRQLTDTTGIVNISRPEVSDDGAWIVFATQDDPLGTNVDVAYEVFTINGDGTRLTQVTDSARPSGVFDNGTAPGDYDISGDGNFVAFSSDFDFTGENPNSDHTIYWATRDGATIGQPLRVGTVTQTSSYPAQNVSISNTGAVMLFESRLSMSAAAVADGNEKIYTVPRQ